MDHPTLAYRPIPCAQHERLEFSVLRGLRLDLTYRAANGTVTGRVLPLDVMTRHGAEWLKFRNADGVEEEIRLDAILDFHEQPPPRARP